MIPVHGGTVLFCTSCLAAGFWVVLFRCLCCFFFWSVDFSSYLGVMTEGYVGVSCWLVRFLLCAFAEDGVPWRTHVPLCSVDDVHVGSRRARRVCRQTDRSGGSAICSWEVRGKCRSLEFVNRCLLLAFDYLLPAKGEFFTAEQFL